ncbi:MAG: hypothetical protein P9L95_10730 [Candidatus Tenebribacter mawsonii]|nr:hypothetical protein [Candidatus Tenebribacter mawsonii]
MKIINKEYYSNELKENILPTLQGKVFHVTNAENYESIKKDNIIKNNKDKLYKYSYTMSENSYGRKRGYICLFDLRNIKDKELADTLLKYYFLNPFSEGVNPVFLVLDKAAYHSLISWETAKKEVESNEMYIPYSECWYRNSIDLSLISEAIILNIPIVPFDGVVRNFDDLHKLIKE